MTVEIAMATQKVNHSKSSKERSFKIGGNVYVRNYDQGPNWINGTIVDSSGPKVTVSDQQNEQNCVPGRDTLIN